MSTTIRNRFSQASTARCFALICLLLISACDGGIFGTGGQDDVLITDTADNPTAQAPSTDVDGVNTNGSSEGSNGAVGTGTSDAGSTDGGSTDAGTGGSVDANTSDADTDAGTTTGDSIDAGSTDSADMDTVAGNTESEATASQNSNVQPGGSDGGRFSNSTATLDTSAVLINVINITSRRLNAFETSLEPEQLLFQAAGIEPNTVSANVNLSNNNTSLAIVDINNVSDALITYDTLAVDEATLTTLVVRQNDSNFSSIALATQTTTTDPSLAKIRVVQAGTLGNPAIEANFGLLSAGANPGGVNNTFGPLTYATPASVYSEVAAGDYELVDSQSRFSARALTLAGGNVYTVVLVGNGTNSVLLVNDSTQ